MRRLAEIPVWFLDVVVVVVVVLDVDGLSLTVPHRCSQARVTRERMKHCSRSGIALERWVVLVAPQL